MNKSKRRILCSILLLAFPLFQGCGDGPSSSRSFPRPAPGSPELTFSIYESGGLFSPNKGDSIRQLLSVRTTADYPCANYVVPTAISFSGQSIAVNFAEPHLPGEICLTAFGPATANMILPPIEGSHKLSVLWNGDIEKYLLVVSETLISLTPLDNVRTVPLHRKLWRYPANSVEVHCAAADSSEVCDQLFLALQSVSGLEEFEFGAEATVPFFRGDRFYIYQSDEALSLLDSVVTLFRQEIPGASSRTVGHTIWLDDINWDMFWPR